MIVIKVPLIVAKLFAKLNLIAARVIGYAPMLTPGKIRELSHSNWVCDNTALNIATGWIPRTQLSDGLQRTLCCNGI
jgi:nucleoside-diphosphate-sugar epimerase